ncbi:MAG: hypothetical protein ACR2GY_00060 [Phycisphaerales bacterium]
MRRKKPVLYELLREQREVFEPAPSLDRHTGTSAADHLEVHDAGDEYELPSALAWMAPGRMLRVPVGYVFIGVAVLLTVCLIAYIAGFTSGAGDEDGSGGGIADTGGAIMLENHEIAASLSRERQNGGPNDAGTAGAALAPGNRQQGGGRSAPAGGNTANVNARKIDADPRVGGLNYFSLITTRRESAIQVAEFCRANGLEAYVTPANNGNLSVFVVPGYARDERSSPAIVELETRIQRVFDAWNKKVGRKDLTSWLPRKFSG